MEQDLGLGGTRLGELDVVLALVLGAQTHLRLGDLRLDCDLGDGSLPASHRCGLTYLVNQPLAGCVHLSFSSDTRVEPVILTHTWLSVNGLLCGLLAILDCDGESASYFVQPGDQVKVLLLYVSKLLEHVRCGGVVLLVDGQPRIGHEVW